jgi:hypothetical protein
MWCFGLGVTNAGAMCMHFCTGGGEDGGHCLKTIRDQIGGIYCYRAFHSAHYTYNRLS